MFHNVAPSFDSPAMESGYKSFGTGLDFAGQFGLGKNAVMASPNTDSLEGNLSTSSGGVLRESVPQSYLSPASTNVSSGAHTGCTANTIARHSSVDIRSLGPVSTTLSQHHHQHHHQRHQSSSNNFSERAQLFHLASTTAAPPDDADADNELLDYAGLESLLMAAVGNGSNAPTPTHNDAAAPASTVTQSTSSQTTPLVASTGSHQNKERSSNSVSPVPSRGSNSTAQRDGGSPNVYSGDGTFLYSNLVPDFISSLPTPRILHTHAESVGAMNTVSPLALAMAPGGPTGAATTATSAAVELSTHASSGVMNSSCSASHSAASTGVSVSCGSQPNDAEVRSNLFICGLPATVTDSDLIDIFGKFGPIESAKVMLDIHTGRSRGIAFVKFKDIEHAENAVDTLNGSSLNGHLITVRVANSRAAYLPGNPTNKTFVRNVPLAVSRATLLEYFSQFGEVTDLSVKSDTAQGRHHGNRALHPVDEVHDEKLNIVFITYSTKEAAARAAEATHTKAPFKECNGVPLLAKVAEDTVRRMERLSRRVRGAPGAEGDSKEPSSASTTAAPLNYGVQPGVVMPTVVSVASPGAYPAPTYVTVPGLSTVDVSALTMMHASAAGGNVQAQPQPQMSVFRDVNGNWLYATTAPASAVPSPAQGGVAYTMQRAVAPPPPPPPSPPQQLPPPPPPQPQPQQTVYIQTANGLVATQSPPLQFLQQSQPQAQRIQLQGMQGQIVYMPTSSGAVVPVLYGGATPAGLVQSQEMKPYYMMMSN
jgi:hypothetical protein